MLIAGGTAESVLQKFRKTFSLRFQKKGSGSKESCNSTELGDLGYGDPSEEDSPVHQTAPHPAHTPTPPSTSLQDVRNDPQPDNTEQKHRLVTTFLERIIYVYMYTV